TNANSKYDAYPGSLRRSDQHEDQANDEKQDHQKDNTEQPNEESDEVLNPIDPNSEEGRVNEKIKKQESNFIFGKGISRGKILAAMLF
ncbi:MFS transporter, partial [Staphylococcus saprophyticus]